MKTPSNDVADESAFILSEFQTADLKDPRRSRRLEQIAVAAATHPGDSFPDQAGSEASLEGTYRLLGNLHVNPKAVLAPHIERTAARAAALGTVLAVQDTTTFSFPGEGNREGLGRLLKKGHGFFAHYSIGVGLDGRPLGTLALETIVRGPKPKGRKSRAQSRRDPDNEQLRWSRTARMVEQRLGADVQVIHVMDREADDYAMFADIVSRQQGFVVRIFHDRSLLAASTPLSPGSDTSATMPKLFETMEQSPALGRRTIDLSARPANKPTYTQAIHPPRKARRATVELSAAAVQICRSGNCDPALPKALRLNVVQVREIDPPAGQSPVLWRLITTEPVTSFDQVQHVVDIYRRRWTIEQFFKAIKTGCNYERRQLQSYHALLNALAIFSTVAWHLILLRWLDRHTPEDPAEAVLTPSQIQVLHIAAPRHRLKLPPQLTVHDALSAIARLGGHLRRNRPPGWLTIGRGFEKLLAMEQTYLDTLQAIGARPPDSPTMPTQSRQTCDQL